MCPPLGEVWKLGETLRESFTRQDLEGAEQIMNGFRAQGYYLFFAKTSLGELKRDRLKINEILNNYLAERKGLAFLGWMTICPGNDGHDLNLLRELYLIKVSDFMVQKNNGVCIGASHFWTRPFEERTGLQKPEDDNLYLLVVHSESYEDRQEWLKNQM